MDVTKRTAPRLDRARILAAAVALLDDAGLDGLSTRALAERLGVQSAALYWHFANKEDLVAALAESLLERVMPPPPLPDDDPKRWLRERAHAFRRALLAHRDGARVHAGSRPATSDLPGLDAQVAALVTAGLSPRDALLGVLAVSRYTLGWVLEEQAANGSNLRDEWTASGYSELGEAIMALEAQTAHQNFDRGLRALVVGLLAQSSDRRSSEAAVTSPQ